MPREYTAYEAKAKFSELLRAVMAGHPVVIRYRGRPVAEVRPFAPSRSGLADRIQDLERAGLLTRAPGPAAGGGKTAPISGHPGALGRFLEERE